MKRASSGVSCFRIISGKDPSMKKPIHTNRRTSVAKGAKVANMVTAAPDSRRGCRCTGTIGLPTQLLRRFAPTTRPPPRWLEQVAADFHERLRRAQVAPQRMPLVELDRQQVVARHRPDQAETVGGREVQLDVHQDDAGGCAGRKATNTGIAAYGRKSVLASALGRTAFNAAVHPCDAASSCSMRAFRASSVGASSPTVAANGSAVDTLMFNAWRDPWNSSGAATATTSDCQLAAQ